MKYLLDLDMDKCISCGACAVACMDQHDTNLEHGDPACPVGCLHKDPETGMTVVNPTHCIGCHSCAMACPFGAPKFDPQGKIVKCDGCADRVRRGYPPACVRVCPTGALTLRTEEEQRRQNQAHLLRHVLQLTEDA